MLVSCSSMVVHSCWESSKQFLSQLLLIKGIVAEAQQIIPKAPADFVIVVECVIFVHLCEIARITWNAFLGNKTAVANQMLSKRKINSSHSLRGWISVRSKCILYEMQFSLGMCELSVKVEVERRQGRAKARVGEARREAYEMSFRFRVVCFVDVIWVWKRMDYDKRKDDGKGPRYGKYSKFSRAMRSKSTRGGWERKQRWLRERLVWIGEDKPHRHE